MTQTYPGECTGLEPSDSSSANWYSLSDWRQVETTSIQNLTESKSV